MDKRIAIVITFFLLGCILIFHFLIYTEQIPYGKVWAGKINSVEEMKSFEAFSILLNLFILAVLIVKYKLLEREKRSKIIDFLIWLFVAFFALNTVGNLFAKSSIEMIFGTLLTIVLSVLCFIIVKVRKP